MSIKELRIQTGLSQSKFAHMFDIPVSTLKDWEHERRNPPAYVINMIRTILEMRGVIINDNSIDFCEIRRKRRDFYGSIGVVYSRRNDSGRT